MDTNGGGWTVIQRRKVGLSSFNRDWKQYKKGFGTIRGDFWLGNENIFRMTRQPTVLRIEMEVRGMGRNLGGNFSIDGKECRPKTKGTKSTKHTEHQRSGSSTE